MITSLNELKEKFIFIAENQFVHISVFAALIFNDYDGVSVLVFAVKSKDPENVNTLIWKTNSCANGIKEIFAMLQRYNISTPNDNARIVTDCPTYYSYSVSDTKITVYEGSLQLLEINNSDGINEDKLNEIVDNVIAESKIYAIRGKIAVLKTDADKILKQRYKTYKWTEIYKALLSHGMIICNNGSNRYEYVDKYHNEYYILFNRKSEESDNV